MKKLKYVVLVIISMLLLLAISSCDAEPNIEFIYTEYGSVIVYNMSPYDKDKMVNVEVINMMFDIWASGLLLSNDSYKFHNVPAGISYIVRIQVDTNLYVSEPFTLSKDRTREFEYNGSTYITQR